MEDIDVGTIGASRVQTDIWVMRADGSRPRQRTFARFDVFPDWQLLPS